MSEQEEARSRQEKFERIQAAIANDPELVRTLRENVESAIERAGLTSDLADLRAASEAEGEAGDVPGCKCSLIGVTCLPGSCTFTIIFVETEEASF